MLIFERLHFSRTETELLFSLMATYVKLLLNVRENMIDVTNLYRNKLVGYEAFRFSSHSC